MKVDAEEKIARLEAEKRQLGAMLKNARNCIAWSHPAPDLFVARIDALLEATGLKRPAALRWGLSTMSPQGHGAVVRKTDVSERELKT